MPKMKTKKSISKTREENWFRQIETFPCLHVSLLLTQITKAKTSIT